MKNTILFFLGIILFSCNNPKIEGKNYIEPIKIGMSNEKVIELIGKPSNIEDLGSFTDENGITTKIENWFYGNNQSLTFKNNVVTGMDYNIRITNEKIQHTIDSAKAAENRTDNNFIQQK
jgi:hypothetical protein